MNSTEWDRGLDTGHPAIDEQHRELLVAHADALERARGRDGQATRVAIAGILELTRRHFAFEELLMAESSYGQRVTHAKAHAAFLRDLLDLDALTARDACSPVVRMWLESRYLAWWKFHVRSNDAALAAHLAALAKIPTAESNGTGAAPGEVPA